MLLEIINTDTRHLQQLVEERIMESQIFSLQWLKDDTLIVCGANGLLKIFNFTISGMRIFITQIIYSNTLRYMPLSLEFFVGVIHVSAKCALPPSRECWPTAATIYEELLICGSRAGNVHVYEFNNANEGIKKPVQTLSKIHGKIGVQSFTVLEGKLMTTGRDGTLRFFELSKGGTKSLLMLHRKKMPMDWISSTLRVDGIVLVLGFKEVSN